MKLYLNRYQIQIYVKLIGKENLANKQWVESNSKGEMKEMILCDIFEGFSFEDACMRAEKSLKEKMDTSKLIYPLEFFTTDKK